VPQSQAIKSNVQHVTILQLHYYFIMTSLQIDCRGRRIGVSALSQQSFSSQLSDCSILVL